MSPTTRTAVDGGDGGGVLDQHHGGYIIPSSSLSHKSSYIFPSNSTSYFTAYQTLYQTTYSQSSICCAGYSGSPPNCLRKSSHTNEALLCS